MISFIDAFNETGNWVPVTAPTHISTMRISRTSWTRPDTPSPASSVQLAFPAAAAAAARADDQGPSSSSMSDSKQPLRSHDEPRSLAPWRRKERVWSKVLLLLPLCSDGLQVNQLLQLFEGEGGGPYLTPSAPPVLVQSLSTINQNT